MQPATQRYQTKGKLRKGKTTYEKLLVSTKRKFNNVKIEREDQGQPDSAEGITLRSKTLSEDGIWLTENQIT